MGVQLEVSGLRSQSRLRSQVSGLRSQVSCLRSHVSGLRSQVSGLRSQVSGPGFLVLGLRSQVSGPWVSLGSLWDSLGILRWVYGIYRRALGHGTGNPEVPGLSATSPPQPTKPVRHDLLVLFFFIIR